ncbi:MAG: AbrB family transcriptional regulator [Spirochaetia bacterium]|nr:AbrB family transcriptional regulator [Spirochaetia bacterium]
MQTNLFKSGNSVALRIPQSLWPVSPGTPVEITKQGDQLVISPVRGSLACAIEVFRGFDASFMEAGRESEDELERNW